MRESWKRTISMYEEEVKQIYITQEKRKQYRGGVLWSCCHVSNVNIFSMYSSGSTRYYTWGLANPNEEHEGWGCILRNNTNVLWLFHIPFVQTSRMLYFLLLFFCFSIPSILNSYMYLCVRNRWRNICFKPIYILWTLTRDKPVCHPP